MLLVLFLAFGLLFDKSISALSAALAAQTSVTANMFEYVTTKRRESDLFHACLLYLITLMGILGSTGYRFPPFNQSLLSTAIDNVKEDSLLYSTSSLATMFKAAVRINSQGGTSRYNSPLYAPRAGSSGFRRHPAFPSFGA